MQAALGRVATVIGAQVPIITADWLASLAISAEAHVTDGADATVVTGNGVVDGSATEVRIAKVGCTQVFVIADQGLAWLALACGALVTAGADVAVVASSGIGNRGAALDWVTTVCRARISVVAHFEGSADAASALALVNIGTRVIIIASRVIRRRFAPRLGVAQIGGAVVAVVADHGVAANAIAVVACVVAGASAAVFARCPGLGRTDAALGLVAHIHGAGIVVVANHWRSDAIAIVANVAGGTSAYVVTGAGLGRVLALAGDAIVVRTLEVIVAHAGRWFVRLAIAVVVDQVALFGLGLQGVASTEAVVAATPLSRTSSCSIGVGANRS